MTTKAPASPVWRQQQAAQRALQTITERHDLPPLDRINELTRIVAWAMACRQRIEHELTAKALHGDDDER